VERELQRTGSDTVLRPIICESQTAAASEDIFHRHRPQIIIHAAAHKHVPLMELNPGEAIKTTSSAPRSSPTPHKFDATHS